HHPSLQNYTVFFISYAAPLRQPNSFPTRRSSDLEEQERLMQWTDMYGYVYDCPTILDPTIPFDELYVPKLGMLDTILDEHVKERSEEHTSELQSRENLVCRLLLEKQKITTNISPY